MTDKNIFDLKNLSDIPEVLIPELNITSAIDDKILALFKKKKNRTLNLSEIVIGYYRLYGEEKSRKYFMVTLYRMYKKGLVEKTTKKGEYRINDR